MNDIDETLDKLGLVIQKHEEVFDHVLEIQKEEYEIIPHEIFIVLMMYRKITERLDAIFILIENKSENAARSICRDLIENILYFSYVIKSKERYESKALSYYYSTFIDQVNSSNLLLSNSQRSRKVKKYLNIDGDDNNLLIEKAKRSKKHFTNNLNGDKYRNIKIDRDRLKKKGDGYPNWYSLSNGPKNLRQLAIHCGYEVEYELLYSMYSRQVHSANVMEQFENVNGLAGIKNLRIYENPTLEIFFSIKLGLDSLEKFLDFFGEDEDIQKWIRENIN